MCESLADTKSKEVDLKRAEKKPHEMHFCVDLPTRVQPGAILNPPVVVKLSNPLTKTKTSESGLLWAFVSITDEAGNITLAPPRSDLVAGSLSDSVHTLEGDSESDVKEELGYVSFPNLAIQQPGNYRLRISLMQQDGIQGATNLETILSPVIRVAETAQPVRLGREETAMLNSLRQRGLRLEG